MNSGMGEDDGKWKHTTCREMHSTICKKPLSKYTTCTGGGLIKALYPEDKFTSL